MKNIGKYYIWFSLIFYDFLIYSMFQNHQSKRCIESLRYTIFCNHVRHRSSIIIWTTKRTIYMSLVLGRREKHKHRTWWSEDHHCTCYQTEPHQEKCLEATPWSQIVVLHPDPYVKHARTILAVLEGTRHSPLSATKCVKAMQVTTSCTAAGAIFRYKTIQIIPNMVQNLKTLKTFFYLITISYLSIFIFFPFQQSITSYYSKLHLITSYCIASY